MTKLDFSKMEGHTPGPWMMATNDNTIILTERLDAKGNAHCIADTLVHSGQKSSDENIKNAALIAAAPGMKDEIIRQREVIENVTAALESLDRHCLNKQSLADGAKVMDAKNIVRAILKEIKGGCNERA